MLILQIESDYICSLNYVGLTSMPSIPSPRVVVQEGWMGLDLRPLILVGTWSLRLLHVIPKTRKSNILELGNRPNSRKTIKGHAAPQLLR